tara:strand:- start:263 stop:613 length:351 start_codon:yes stop_codon:yes gene_type:complete
MIIWEMTGQYALILPLIIGNAVAWLLSSRFEAVSLYDSLIVQDKINLRKMPHYRGDRDWQNLPISTIMTFDVVSVGSRELARKAITRVVDEHHKHHAYPVLDDGGLLVGVSRRITS